MLASGQDENDEIYHSVHMLTGERYDRGLDKFRQAQAAGDVPDFLVQFVNLAMSFKICKPINSEFMSLGWYDKLKVRVELLGSFGSYLLRELRTNELKSRQTQS